MKEGELLEKEAAAEELQAGYENRHTAPNRSGMIVLDEWIIATPPLAPHCVPDT